MVRLVPMTPAAFVGFRAWLIENYAAENVRTGGWPPEGSRERATRELDSLLAQGVSTPDQFVHELHSDAGEHVGNLWFARRAMGSLTELFVYWIGIDAAFRRQGHAQSALSQVHEEARRLGATRVSLHVFGDNRGAIALYEGLGFRPTNLMMAWPVAP